MVLLHLQRIVSRCAFLPLQALERFFLKAICGYEIVELENVRREFASLAASAGSRPILICGNHLTLIDSLIQAWALADPWYYFWNFSNFPWSLPEYRNFYRDPFRAILSFLHKGLPVFRGGAPAKTERTISRINYLLTRGEAISIFPEGGRSKDGRLNMKPGSYAVGRLLQRHPEAFVICVHIRGRDQDSSSDYPIRGERFRVKLQRFEPEFTGRGLRQRRELSLRILERLSEMENSSYGELDASRK